VNNEDRKAKPTYIVPEQVDPIECYKVFFNKRGKTPKGWNPTSRPLHLVTVLNNQGHVTIAR